MQDPITGMVWDINIDNTRQRSKQLLFSPFILPPSLVQQFLVFFRASSWQYRGWNVQNCTNPQCHTLKGILKRMQCYTVLRVRSSAWRCSDFLNSRHDESLEDAHRAVFHLCRVCKKIIHKASLVSKTGAFILLFLFLHQVLDIKGKAMCFILFLSFLISFSDFFHFFSYASFFTFLLDFSSCFFSHFFFQISSAPSGCSEPCPGRCPSGGRSKRPGIPVAPRGPSGGRRLQCFDSWGSDLSRPAIRK